LATPPLRYSYDLVTARPRWLRFGYGRGPAGPERRARRPFDL